MPKIYRLSRADFSSLRTLRKEYGSFFTLTISKSPDNKPRFACVVSKKVARKAHDRNLIKRRCRAALREVSLKAPLAFVFTGKRSAEGATYVEISDDVKSLFVKALASLKVSPELQ
jgi:ribonuclease P protein component